MMYISWKKEYAFLTQEGLLAKTEKGGIDKISLNIFERFFRLLGFYKNTHLSLVGKAAKISLFDPKFANNEEVQKIAKKSLLKEGFKGRKELILLGEEKLSSTGDIVRYEARFPNLSSFTNVNSSPLNEVDFLITLNPQGEKRAAHVFLTRAKHRNGEYENKISLSSITAEMSFSSDSDDPLPRIIAAFIKKLSASSPKVKELKTTSNFEAQKITGQGSQGDLVTFVQANKWDKMNEILKSSIESCQITPQTIGKDPEYTLTKPICIDSILS